LRTRFNDMLNPFLKIHKICRIVPNQIQTHAILLWKKVQPEYRSIIYNFSDVR